MRHNLSLYPSVINSNPSSFALDLDFTLALVSAFVNLVTHTAIVLTHTSMVVAGMREGGVVVGCVLVGIRSGDRPRVSGGRSGDGVGMMRVMSIINIIILFIAVVVVVDVGVVVVFVVVGVFTIVYSFYRCLLLCCHYHQKSSYKTSHKSQDPCHET